MSLPWCRSGRLWVVSRLLLLALQLVVIRDCPSRHVGGNLYRWTLRALLIGNLCLMFGELDGAIVSLIKVMVLWVFFHSVSIAELLKQCS